MIKWSTTDPCIGQVSMELLKKKLDCLWHIIKDVLNGMDGDSVYEKGLWGGNSTLFAVFDGYSFGEILHNK